MAQERGHARRGSKVWRLARRQHGVVTRAQLLELGWTDSAIYHRVGNRRLHPVHRGVFAVGTPELTRRGRGRLMAAVLACGDRSLVSHHSAAELWEIRRPQLGPFEISAPVTCKRRPQGVTVHRRRGLGGQDRRLRFGIPVTSPIRTLIDLATQLTPAQLESAVNEADKLDLVDPERLRSALVGLAGQPGVPAVRNLLDRRTFVLTASELERLFVPIVRSVGLPLPETSVYVNGFEVDFFWRELGLVVETDGLRYHRTPAEQARDRLRDQIHAAAGLTPLRFTHAQVRFEPKHVREVLRRVAERLVDGSADGRHAA